MRIIYIFRLTLRSLSFFVYGVNSGSFLINFGQKEKFISSPSSVSVGARPTFYASFEVNEKENLLLVVMLPWIMCPFQFTAASALTSRSHQIYFVSILSIHFRYPFLSCFLYLFIFFFGHHFSLKGFVWLASSMTVLYHNKYLRAFLASYTIYM